MTALPINATTRYEHLTGEYVFDKEHSRIGFTARHAMITKVRGHFDAFEGELVIDGKQPANSRVTVTIAADSINTGIPQRDEHLRSSDFLSTDHHREIVFRSLEVKEVGEATFRLTGDLSIRGTSRPLTFDVHYAGVSTDPWGTERLVFEAALTINRRDWGITWNTPLDSGGVLVSEKVALELEVAVVRKA